MERSYIKSWFTRVPSAGQDTNAAQDPRPVAGKEHNDKRWWVSSRGAAAATAPVTQGVVGTDPSPLIDRTTLRQGFSWHPAALTNHEVRFYAHPVER
jgi:hypothetical protein